MTMNRLQLFCWIGTVCFILLPMPVSTAASAEKKILTIGAGSIHTDSLTLVAADDADISRLKDLKGKTVSIGSFGSCRRINAKDLLKAVGVLHLEG